jgi:hypothetical protein
MNTYKRRGGERERATNLMQVNSVCLFRMLNTPGSEFPPFSIAPFLPLFFIGLNPRGRRRRRRIKMRRGRRERKRRRRRRGRR